MASILCGGYKNRLKILFCYPTKYAFTNESYKILLAFAIEAWDLVASMPMGGMGF